MKKLLLLLFTLAAILPVNAQTKMYIETTDGGRMSFPVHMIKQVYWEEDNVKVTHIVLDKSSLTMRIDDTYTLTATVYPTYAKNQEIAWTSSDPSIVSVSKTGEVVAIDFGTATITCTAKDGSGAKAECVVTVINIVPYTHAVDLGLLSGTKWADMNVGAESPEDYGWYLAWGETKEKEVYNWSTYKYMADGYSDVNGCSKYQHDDWNTDGIWYNGDTFVGDNKTVLDPEDDAAHVNWGGNWRMPTKDEMDELCACCTWTWVSQNGVMGSRVEGPNGNSIFLPAAGRRESNMHTDKGSRVYCWASSNEEFDQTNDASCLANHLDMDSTVVVYRNILERWWGFCVRPVLSE